MFSPRWLIPVLLSGLVAAPLSAQSITGTILGTVQDSSGAVVAAAKVTVTNAGTNQSTTAPTNESGYYEIPYLKPGEYAVQVAAAGFKTTERKGVTLSVESRVRLNFELEVGDAATSISVSAAAPLVEAETASLGQVVTAKNVVDLPTKGHNIFDLAILSTGVEVNPRALGGVASSGDNGNPLFVFSDISINGGRYRTNDFLVDGISIMLPENNNFAFSPTPDGTQEFKIMTNAFGPQFGRSGGGVVNVVTRTGSNGWHGSAYDQFRNDRLEANNFFANANRQPRGPFHFNLFGGSIGAPIRKDKTFFFAEYQGHRALSTLGGQLLTLPTTAERSGDFSQTRNQAGQAVTIFDPSTTQPVQGGYTRTAFPGNRIPASQLDPTSLKLLSFIPQPNQPGSGPALVNNYAWLQNAFVHSDQWSVRIDHRFNDRHSLFGRFTRNTGDAGNNGPFGTVADNIQGDDVSHVINGVLNDTLALSPTTLVNIRYGVTRRFEGRVPLHTDVNLASLGFPASLAAAADEQIYPVVSFANYSSWGPPSGTVLRRGNSVHTLVGDTTLIRGRHTLVLGADVRLYDQTPYQSGSDGGSYSFSSNFTQGPNPLVTSLTAGDSFASFLTGYGSGNISKVPALAIRNWYTAVYCNDEIKLGRLTVDAGLRWEYSQPPTERYNRFSTFDFTAPFPIQVPGLPGLKGVLTFPGQDGQPRGQYDSYWKSFGPRVGLAYSLNSRMAIRAGYGIFYAPRMGTTSASNFGTSGATQTTTWVSSLDGVTPLNPLSNPFPGVVFPALNNPADRLQLGQSVTVMDRRNVSNTNNQQWNFNVQRELPGGFLVEAGYAGNKGTHLPVAVQMDQLSPIYQSLGAALTNQVSNPFFGLASTGTLAARTVAMSQLLRPYPQYTGVNPTTPVVAQNEASSTYHAFIAKIQKRFSKGVSFLLAYTDSKLIDNSSGRIFGLNAFSPPVQNAYDLRAERAVSEGDVTQQLVFTHTVELPLGRGKRFLGSAPAAVDLLLGGWSVSGTMTFSSGFPLALTSSGNSGVGSATLRPNSTGVSAALDGSVESRLTKYFNTAAFTVPAPFTFGNVSRTVPDVRNPSRRNYDLALAKQFRLREPVSLLFRAEAFNLTNTPYFLSPGLALGSGSFGVISAATGDRQVQLGLRLLF
jgi:hypothetical protein